MNRAPGRVDRPALGGAAARRIGRQDAARHARQARTRAGRATQVGELLLVSAPDCVATRL